MSDLGSLEQILMSIKADVISALQDAANTQSPQELILKPELLDLLSKYKIEKETM